jgi:2-dehydropantoate 2-reductase
MGVTGSGCKNSGNERADAPVHAGRSGSTLSAGQRPSIHPVGFGSSMESDLRIAIMGAGGVGGYFGARLVKGGADVHFIARGAHLAAMREHGLAVEGGPEAIHVPEVNVTAEPESIGPVDMVMFCVKLWDTESAARSLVPIMKPETGIISFQNGVTKDDMLRPIFGDQALLGGVAYVGTSIGRPGVIAQTGPLQRLVFGEYDGRRSERIETFHRACKRGGINAEISDDVRRSIWEKYVVLVAMSGATTAMRCTIGPIRSHALTRAFLIDLAREVVAVGRALGVALPADYVEQRIPFFDGWPPEMTTSMHHDLQNGRPLEVRWLSGGVVDLGAQAGVPTPMNRAVRDILVLHAQGRQ